MEVTKKSKSHVIDLLFTLSLFCVFAASSLLIVVMGANVYKSTVSNMSANFDNRTSLAYTFEKVRQNDRLNGVYIGKVDDADALVLEQAVGSNIYATYIYYYEGTLREIFTRKDNKFSPNSGNVIMKIRSFTVEKQNDNLILLTVTTDDNKKNQIFLGTRCE